MADLESANFFSLQALLTLSDFEFHALTFCQTAETAGLNGGMVDENVLAGLALDKAEAFGVVKPLYCALFHR